MAGIDDEEEFAEYAAGSLPRLRRIAFLLCQDWHRADDLTQSALTNLYVHWRRAKAAENRDAYVGAILMNAYLAEQRTAWWKRTSVRPEPVGEPSAALATAAAGRGAPVEELLDLRAALRTLAPRRRATVVLRYYCDYSVEQTAQLLGCSAGTVKSQTAKALLQLRGALEPQDAVGGAEGAEAASTEILASSPRASHRIGPNASGRTL
jgi:RNA polymerase sigma-70 factor (sigma-E family)